MIKGTSDNYDKMVINRTGNVYIEQLRNGIVTTDYAVIDFRKGLI